MIPNRSIIELDRAEPIITPVNCAMNSDPASASSRRHLAASMGRIGPSNVVDDADQQGAAMQKRHELVCRAATNEQWA